jgi:hypothetical protein
VNEPNTVPRRPTSWLIHPATLRNRVTRAEHADIGPAPATATEPDELKALRPVSHRDDDLGQCLRREM